MISKKQFLKINSNLIEKAMKDYDLDDFSIHFNGHENYKPRQTAVSPSLPTFSSSNGNNNLSFSFTFTKEDFEGFKNEIKKDNFSSDMSNLLSEKPRRRNKKKNSSN